MKKLLSLILAAVLIISIFSGCSSNSNNSSEGDGKIKVVTTIFPLYDWTKNVIGDDVHSELTVLMNNGTDLHNYQPTADDIIRISNCDVFIYVGGESDKWVDDTLNSARNKNMKVVNLMETLGDKAKKEETVEGMQSEEEEEEEEGYDEHIWLSLNNASVCVYAIAKALGEVDAKDSDKFSLNAKEYNNNLVALDKQYRDAVEKANTKTLLFGDRFPFRYMTEDYGLDYYAAFSGCSAESEASFETISFLANKADELGLSHIITIDGSSQELAMTILTSTKKAKLKILTLNSMQSVTQTEIDSGVTYLSIMENNLEALKIALS